MGYNNIIPNVHFRKYWQKDVRCWFNQAARKKGRKIARDKRAVALFPRPAGGKLRPVVHPGTQRYNFKLRVGRGFTLQELKAAGFGALKARQLGISVDTRRTNKCEESLKINANRLKEYKKKLLVFPRSSLKKPKKGDSSKEQLKDVKQNKCKTVLPVPKPRLREAARAITAEEKGVEAYRILRKKREEQKNFGKKLKKEMDAKAN